MPRKISAANAVPESAILRACLDLLAAERILAFRMNTGAFAIQGAHKKRFVRVGQRGMADILFTIRASNKFALVCWCEVKSIHGKQTPEQGSFQRHVESEGHRYIVARSCDELVAAIRCFRAEAANEKRNS